MSIHKEDTFETEVCAHLAAHGWRYAADDASRFDRARALFPSDLIDWVKETQPKSWEALSAMHGASAEGVLLDRVRSQIDDRGTLDVLRHGVELHPAKGKIALAQFKPALAMNLETLARYAANRLRVIRQVRYSLHNENCLDREKTKVGYEIPFTRHFYVFEPPRSLEEIDADLKQVTGRILQMIGGLSA